MQLLLSTYRTVCLDYSYIVRPTIFISICLTLQGGQEENGDTEKALLYTHSNGPAHVHAPSQQDHPCRNHSPLNLNLHPKSLK